MILSIKITIFLRINWYYFRHFGLYFDEICPNFRGSRVIGESLKTIPWSQCWKYFPMMKYRKSVVCAHGDDDNKGPGPGDSGGNTNCPH